MKWFRSSFASLMAGFLVVAGPLVAQTEKDDSSNVVATYAVHQGKLTDKPSPDHQKIWAVVTSFVPRSLVDLVDTLEFFEVPQDQKDEDLVTDAYAEQNENGQSFTLGINLDNARLAVIDQDPDTRLEFYKTIAHEFGHVLSFQASQMDATETVTGTLVIDEGTLKPDAYLNQFYEKFWKKRFPGHAPAASSDADGTKLYQENPGVFVTEYAATGPLEDFAESFAVFVTEPLPSGQGVRDDKVRFFSGYPELVNLRDEFRRGLPKS